jgi:hypothetical protein
MEHPLKLRAPRRRRGATKLTAQQVLMIRRLLATGVSQKKVAARYKVTPGNISSINLRKTWTDVGGPEGRHTSESVGERNGRARLRESDVRQIRRKLESIPDQAARYGVSRGTIEAIRGRRLWRHVKP